MNEIQKDFVPYEEAVALKELGFDEPCSAFFTWKKELKPIKQWDVFNSLKNSEVNTIYCSSVTPTYSQAFRWIRKRCNILAIVSYCDDNSGKFMAVIDKINGYIDYDMNPKNTYEEAELECLKQLIKIIKENDN